MKDTSFARRFSVVTALALITTAGACDSTESPTALEDEPIVVLGHVASVTQVDPSLGPSLSSSSSSSLGGIEVSIEGGTAADLTDDGGNFRLEVRQHDGRLRIRFRRGSLDVRLEIEGVATGTVVQFVVVLDHGGATLLSSHDGREAEFEGVAALVSVDGESPSRTVRVELTDSIGSTLVDIVEDRALFDNEGDITTLTDLLAALDRTDLPVKIEGEGERQDDGTIVAAGIKVETDEHDDDQDDENDDEEIADADEFEGVAALVSVDGETPSRTVRVELTDSIGSTLVDIVEDRALFDNEGDITTLTDLLAALDRADLTVKIEGEGERQDDGTIVAAGIKVETDGHDDDQDDDNEDDEIAVADEFEGVAALVSVDGESPSRTVRVELTDSIGSKLVDIVEDGTVFDNEGDIMTLTDLLTALDRTDLTVKIEGEGERQDDGTIVAAGIKVETDQAS